MTNLTLENIDRKIRFLRNINKSSIGHFACLKQYDEDGDLKSVVRVVASTKGEYPRKFYVTSSRLPHLERGRGYTLESIEDSLLDGPIV